MFALFVVLPALLPWIGGYTYLGTEVMIWAIFALGYNLLLGYTGLPAFGHGAFFGMAGYFLGATRSGLAGGLWAAARSPASWARSSAAPLVGLFVARRRGIYFSLLTIAFGVMFWFMVFFFDTWTGGEDGLTGIQRGPVVLPCWGALSLRDNLPFYYFVYVLFVRGDDRPLADRPLALRPGDRRGQAERVARPGARLRHAALQVGGVHAVDRLRRAGGGSLHAGALRRLRRAHEPAAVGQRGADVLDRRGLRLLLRPGARGGRCSWSSATSSPP